MNDPFSFEEKVALLALTDDPKAKQELIAKFSNNAEFFAAVNRKTMPLDQYMRIHAAEFQVVADRAKVIRDGIKHGGWTDKKYQKYTGEIPERLLLERPEFSANIPRKKFTENMRIFLQMYPQFRVDK